MRTLNTITLENIHGGGDISNTISGACLAIGLAGALKIIAVSAPVGVGISVACIVNGFGGYMDWW